MFLEKYSTIFNIIAIHKLETIDLMYYVEMYDFMEILLNAKRVIVITLIPIIFAPKKRTLMFYHFETRAFD